MAQKRIDWQAVREARARLDDLARTYPELTGPRGPENVTAWEEVLQVDEEARMVRTMTEHTAFRLTPDLIERMDKFAAEWAKRSGLRVSRADVARKAIERFMAAGVEVAIAPAPAPATKRRG